MLAELGSIVTDITFLLEAQLASNLQTSSVEHGYSWFHWRVRSDKQVKWFRSVLGLQSDNYSSSLGACHKVRCSQSLQQVQKIQYLLQLPLIFH